MTTSDGRCTLIVLGEEIGSMIRPQPVVAAGQGGSSGSVSRAGESHRGVKVQGKKSPGTLGYRLNGSQEDVRLRR